MSSFPILHLVIGIIFIYFLLSITCSSAVELFFSLLNTRAKLLTKWLIKIFDKPALDSSGQPITEKDKDGSDKKGKDNKPIYRTVGQEIADHCMTTALSDTGTSTTY